jgi:predicted amidophosphoribosyltransferase
MLCPSCGSQNAEGVSYCSTCGAEITSSCASCGRNLAPGSQFCDACGTPVVNGVTQTIVGPPALEAMPTSFADGCYVVKDLLGKGATKQVYGVHDTVLDRVVAFALIHP